MYLVHRYNTTQQSHQNKKYINLFYIAFPFIRYSLNTKQDYNNCFEQSYQVLIDVNSHQERKHIFSYRRHED
jgi:hypothetical protein